MIVSLKELPVKNRGRIKEFKGGIQFKLRLTQLGLHAGDVIRVKRNGIFSGPLIVEVMGREIALGKGIANKVMVEVIE